MSELDGIIRDLVIANRILAHEGVLDAYGHVSVRHPSHPDRYLLSRSRSPELVGPHDILEFSLEGDALTRKHDTPYTERHIHGAVYESRADIHAVVHSHAPDVLPFGIVKTPLRPVVHVASAMGGKVPVWDIRERFGDTDLLVSTIEQGRDLARGLGEGYVVLMRGHGFSAAGRTLREVVKTSVYVRLNARVLMDALRLGGEVQYLSQGEIDIRLALDAKSARFDRAWEYWSARAGMRASE
jgi:HCOMODA/2-hydroxy-3-carboxy-muconic semialdehyde decarboxylase